MVFINHPAHGILLQQPEGTKTELINQSHSPAGAVDGLNAPRRAEGKDTLLELPDLAHTIIQDAQLNLNFR